MIGRGLDRLFVRFRDKNDGAALAAVFDATSRALLDVACHLVRNPSDAEDLLQATFLTAIEKAPRYDGSSPVQAWLYGILWREAAKMRRSAVRTIEVRDLSSRSESSPVEIVQREEIPQSVMDALGRIPTRYREVLEPWIRAEESADALARRLGRSPGTIRSQVHRGMEKLRRALPPGLASLPSMGLAVRGLPSIRATVLRSAGYSPTTAAVVTANTLGFAIGGAIVSMKSLVVAGVAAVALLGAGFTAGRWVSRSEIVNAASVARPPGSPWRGSESPTLATAESPERVSASSESQKPSVSSDARDSESSIEYWLARYNEAPEDAGHGQRVTREIVKLSPDEALRIMAGVWPHLSATAKEASLDVFVIGGAHVHALKILDLAATDAEIPVQAAAFHRLIGFSFRDFSTDFEGYQRWSKRYRDQPLKDVVSENARGFVSELLSLNPPRLRERALELRNLNVDRSVDMTKVLDVSTLLKESGGLKVLESLLQDQDPKARSVAFDWSKWMRADETWLRTWVLPSIRGSQEVNSEALAGALDALGRKDCTWASRPILDFLQQHPANENHAARFAGMALDGIGDPSVIPELIELLLHDTTGTLEYDVGYFGLSRLTGVHWQKGYDGAWWLDWWEKNKMRLPPGVRDAVIRR